ncbi:MAG: Asp-tRNA(Asn)/Glu-tRNA(Gln) amidotransferase subunit GatC [Planctomycetes bacterium]|nr:Asp-tRNA(Asn)/Glu-tRNA(Gln) amidotransferase subunit GatC [Planctomycetota bacterium]
MPEPLSLDEVRHIARLARLAIDDTHLEQYRTKLASILDHIAMLSELDVSGVEPMSHPHELTNRLGDDVVEDAMPLEDLLRNAPAVEGRYLAVPKVLGDDGGA